MRMVASSTWVQRSPGREKGIILVAHVPQHNPKSEATSQLDERKGARAVDVGEGCYGSETDMHVPTLCMVTSDDITTDPVVEVITTILSRVMRWDGPTSGESPGKPPLTVG